MEDTGTLVRRVQEGDRGAFRELVGRFQDMVYGCAYAVLGDFHLAEDASVDAFLAAYQDLGKLREPKAFPGWLRRIVLRQCQRRLRRKRVQKAPLEAAAGVASAGPGPVQVAEARELRDKVLDAIRELPGPQRMVTTLFYINGYSHREIADFLEVALTTVNSRLHASRKRLKERMLKMVEKKLKARRLGSRFLRRLLERVDLVRVEVQSERHEALLLTDQEGRTFILNALPGDVEKTKSYLQKPEGTLHHVLLNTVKALGGEVVEFVIGRIKERERTIAAALVVRQGQRRHEIECPWSDGVLTALQAGVPIYAERGVVRPVVTKGKGGKLCVLETGRKLLESMAEESRKAERNVTRLRKEVAKHPRSVETRLKLASALRLGKWEEALEVLQSALRTARSKRQKAKVHAAFATCWWLRHRLEKVEEHLRKAREFSPDWEQFLEARVDAYVKAMALFEEWARTEEPARLDAALHSYEEFLRSVPPELSGRNMPQMTVTENTVRKLSREKKYRDYRSGR